MALAMIVAVLLLGPIAVGSGLAVLRYNSEHRIDLPRPRTHTPTEIGFPRRRRKLPPAA